MDRELDELLSEAKELLGEKQPTLRAEDIQIDYSRFYDEMPPETAAPAPTPAPKLTAYEQSRPAYQTAKQDLERIERELKKKKPQTQSRKKEPKEPVEVPKAKKSRHGWLLLILLLLLAVPLTLMLLAKQPVGNSSAARKEDCSTVLLIGTDAGGFRTDTMMLLSVDRREKSVSLVSVPRDTLVYCSYSVPKINSAYGWAGGGDAGIEELMARLQDILGFRPDGYLMVDLDAFAELVDSMGGVRFNVPMDMHYADPSQELYIDLNAGMQKLSGDEAMQLVRFRSGYPDADLGRVSVQRDFVTAALSQWVGAAGLLHLPQALAFFSESVSGDLSVRNDLWLAEAVLRGKRNVHSCTLPGSAATLSGGSYYILNAQQVAETVNTYCNPYQEAITADSLSVRVG